VYILGNQRETRETRNKMETPGTEDLSNNRYAINSRDASNSRDATKAVYYPMAQRTLAKSTAAAE
jgi:hypothetical protein